MITITEDNYLRRCFQLRLHKSFFTSLFYYIGHLKIVSMNNSINTNYIGHSGLCFTIYIIMVLRRMLRFPIIKVLKNLPSQEQLAAKAKLWTKDFTIVSTANFFLYLVFYLLLVTMAAYAVDQLNASESQAGLVTGIFIIGTLIGRLFLGRLITTIGNKKMLYFGLIFFIITSLLYFVESGITFLLFNPFSSWTCTWNG